jgi:outer membrane lipoprotein carrier protein
MPAAFRLAAPAKLAFATLLLLGSAAASAAAPAPKGAARQQFDAFSRNLAGLQGSFDQRVYDPNGRQSEQSSGTVKLSAPRQFRWEYLKPSPQLIVADGDQVWLYDPDLEQVTVRKQSLEEQQSPLAVLIDPTELERRYKVAEAGAAGGLSWLSLAPKAGEDAPFKKARLGFGAAGLARMELFDALGQRTVIAFSPWQRNPRFAANTFRFVPPKGTDVVGTPVEHAQVRPLRD